MGHRLGKERQKQEGEKERNDQISPHKEINCAWIAYLASRLRQRCLEIAFINPHQLLGAHFIHINWSTVTLKAFS